MERNECTILIVDNCLEDRETYRRYLLADDRYSYIILEEDYGENGLEICKLVKPDLILLNFLLPDIDGIEFLTQLKTQFGTVELPVVMLTANGDIAIAVQVMKCGAADYLVKGKTTSENLRLAIHNVIERDRLTQQLAQSEQRFRTSIENMLDCFGIYKSIRDESGKIIDFLVEYVNQQACVNNRMTQAEQIGKRLLELLPQHLETGLFAEYCQVVETGKPLVKEALIYSDIYNKQYLTRAFDIRVAKLGDGFVASWRDISDRKLAEQRLQLLESVVVNANDAVVISEIAPIDAPGPRIMYVNLAFTRMTGYSSQEVIGRSPRFLQGEKTDRATRDRIRAALQRKQPIQEELINYHKDGSEFWVEISITPVADAAGNYTHFVSIQRNITERKRTEEALRESQHFIQQIATTIPDILYIYDLKEQRNIFVNRQIALVLGYSPEAIGEMGTDVLSILIHPEDKARLSAHFQKFDTDGDRVLEFKYRMQAANGEWRWFCSREILFNRNADGAARQILGIARDISDRKYGEAALRRYAEIFEHNELGLVVASSDGQTIDFMNSAFAKMHGYTVEEMKGLPILKLFPPEYHADAKEYIKLVDDLGHCTFESKHIRKDGIVFPVCIDVTSIKHEDGSLVYRIVSVQDITERKFFEEALQKQALVLESMAEAVVMSDTNGVILYTNPAFERMFGYEKGELIGQFATVLNYYSPEENTGLTNEILTTLQANSCWFGEFDNRKKDGSCFTTKASISAVNFAGRTYTISVQEDISDRKRIESERIQLLEREQQAREQAEAANRAKDDFVAMVSHDLRSPLNGILGWTNLARLRQQDEATVTKALEIIDRNAQAQAKLLEDLLDISRMIQGRIDLQLSNVELIPLIEAAIDTSYPVANVKGLALEFVQESVGGEWERGRVGEWESGRKGVNTTSPRHPLTPSSPLPLVVGDANRLQQVLLNLLSNAIKFTPVGGRIEVRLSIVNSSLLIVHSDKQLAIDNQQSTINNYVQIQVIDTGVGISPEFLPHVFDRFRQENSTTRQRGLGLGLAICRHLVELHGGTIEAQSPGIGQGSTFTVKIPLFERGRSSHKSQVRGHKSQLPITNS